MYQPISLWNFRVNASYSARKLSGVPLQSLSGSFSSATTSFKLTACPVCKGQSPAGAGGSAFTNLSAMGSGNPAGRLVCAGISASCALFTFAVYSSTVRISFAARSAAASFCCSGSRRESFKAAFFEIFWSDFFIISFVSGVRFLAVCICLSMVRGTTPSFSAVSCTKDFDVTDILSLTLFPNVRFMDLAWAIPSFVSGWSVS